MVRPGDPAGHAGPARALLARHAARPRPLQGHALPARQAAWYTKPLPTFVDTLALVRRELWAVPVFSLSSQSTDLIEIPRSRSDRVTNALAYAA